MFFQNLLYLIRVKRTLYTNNITFFSTLVLLYLYYLTNLINYFFKYMKQLEKSGVYFLTYVYKGVLFNDIILSFMSFNVSSIPLLFDALFLYNS